MGCSATCYRSRTLLAVPSLSLPRSAIGWSTPSIFRSLISAGTYHYSRMTHYVPPNAHRSPNSRGFCDVGFGGGGGRATRIDVGAEGPHDDPSRTDTAGSTSRHRIRLDREAVGRIRSGAVETAVTVRLVVARPPTPLRCSIVERGNCLSRT